MRRITAIWEAFYSKTLYADSFHFWKGIGFITLLVLAVIQTLLLSMLIQIGLNAFVNHSAPLVVHQIPPLTFNNGVLSTPQAIAYKVTDPGGGNLFALIDTRVEHPPADLGGAYIFAAQKSVTMKKSDSEQRSYDYSALGNRVVDEKTIQYWMDALATWGAIFCAPFIIGFLLVWRMLQLLFFSLITLLVCLIMKEEGSYAAKLRLTSLALIPGIVYSMVLSASEKDFTGSSWLFFFIVIGFIFFGANAIKSSAPAEEATLPPPLT